MSNMTNIVRLSKKTSATKGKKKRPIQFQRFQNGEIKKNSRREI